MPFVASFWPIVIRTRAGRYWKMSIWAVKFSMAHISATHPIFSLISVLATGHRGRHHWAPSRPGSSSPTGESGAATIALLTRRIRRESSSQIAPLQTSAQYSRYRAYSSKLIPHQSAGNSGWTRPPVCSARHDQALTGKNFTACYSEEPRRAGSREGGISPIFSSQREISPGVYREPKYSNQNCFSATHRPAGSGAPPENGYDNFSIFSLPSSSSAVIN